MLAILSRFLPGKLVLILGAITLISLMGNYALWNRAARITADFEKERAEIVASSWEEANRAKERALAEQREAHKRQLDVSRKIAEEAIEREARAHSGLIHAQKRLRELEPDDPANSPVDEPLRMRAYGIRAEDD